MKTRTKRLCAWLCRLAPALLLLLSVGASGCFVLRSSEGGGEARFEAPREIDAEDVALPDGYSIHPVVTGLTFPSAVAFDDEGGVYVIEAGYSYDDVVTVPRLLRVEPDGRLTEIATGTNPPWNGAVFHDGAFYVAGGHVEHGQILRITPTGEVESIIEGLPSLGDHHTNGPAVGPDGALYFGQGTATNSAVVGPDNFDFGWLQDHPDFHDIPCKDVVLSGENFETTDPMTSDENDRTTTGAFVPFGTATHEGQRIAGRIPCSGAIFRLPPDGGQLELVAWGMRNPFGLAWSPSGDLFVTDNQYDDRGARPVFGAGDLLWRVEPDTWYGWPDYSGGRPLTDADWFKPPGEARPRIVLSDHPNVPPEPDAFLGVHSSSNGIDFSTNPEFGHVGEAFIAQFGDMAPNVGKVLSPVGFKIVRVETSTGIIREFAVNRGKVNGPATRLGHGGLERPVSVAFSPDGTELYVVDFGVMTTRGGEITPYPETGVLWKITRSGERRR